MIFQAGRNGAQFTLIAGSDGRVDYEALSGNRGPLKRYLDAAREALLGLWTRIWRLLAHCLSLSTQ